MIILNNGIKKIILYPIDQIDGNHEWYSILGFLIFSGYPINEISEIPHFSDKTQNIIIFIAGKSDRKLNRITSLTKSLYKFWKIVIVGREATYQFDNYISKLGRFSNIFVGDPHYTILDILEGKDITTSPSIWDPNKYKCSYYNAPWVRDTAFVRISNGCQRNCCYCPHGYHYNNLFGSSSFLIRSIDSIIDEINTWIKLGKYKFRFIADQALLSPTYNNDFIEEICKYLNSKGRFLVSFTTTPHDIIANKLLLEKCRKYTEIQLFVCFDFLLDCFNNIFNLPSTEFEIKESVHILNSLSISIYPHFIIFHPLLTEKSLYELFSMIQYIIENSKTMIISELKLFHLIFNSCFHQDITTPAEPRFLKKISNSTIQINALNYFSILYNIFSNEKMYSYLKNCIDQKEDWFKSFCLVSKKIINKSNHLLSEEAINEKSTFLLDFILRNSN